MEQRRHLSTQPSADALPPIVDDPQPPQPVAAESRSGLALALSGGGYRATLFHLGALRRLDEIGILTQVDTISSVSGGSITAGILANHMIDEAPPQQGRYPAWPGVQEDVELLCRRNIRTMPLLSRVLPWNWANAAAPIQALVRRYGREITQLPVASLPLHPRFVFCATDMAYGVNWIFSRDKAGSYMAGHAFTVPDRVTIAQAIGASSCFPPVFAPLPAGLGPADLAGGHDESADRAERVRGLRLSDGGLYDNLGLEPVWRHHRFLLVSDGGGVFSPSADQGMLWRLSRYTQIQGRQVGALRKRWLISSFIASNPENPEADPDRGLAGTYWGIGTNVSEYQRPVPGYRADVVEAISKIRTDLDSFSRAEIEVLINHGYLLAAAAAERWLRPFGLISIDAEVDVPYPQRMDDDQALVDLSNSHKRNLPFGRRN